MPQSISPPTSCSSSPRSSAEARASDGSGPKKDGSYVLGVGASGFDRLEVSEEAYGRATPGLIDVLRASSPPLWPQGAVCMAVLACGSGSQLKSLRGLVGTDGRLFCTDISQQQIDSAHTHAARLGLDHVQFDTLDIMQAPPAAQYDVVYARFVLVHLQAPEKALTHMWQMVRPGGLLLSEEHNAAGINAEPSSSAVDRAKDLLLAMGDKRGVDYNLGQSSQDLFARAHVPVSGMSRTNFSYTEGRPKKLFEMSLREGAQQYIDAGLITKDSMQSLLGELGAYTDRSDTQMYMGDFVQTWAQKPAH